MSINFPDGTQDYPSKILQITHYQLDSTVYFNINSGGGYIIGGSSSGLTISPKSSSNRIMIMGNLAMGENNINGGLKWLLNGSTLLGGTYIWDVATGSTYIGGSTAYTNGWNTADNSTGCSSQYGIGPCPINLITKSGLSLPSTCYFSFYGQTGSDTQVYVNRQRNNNGGRAVSVLHAIEVEDS